MHFLHRSVFRYPKKENKREKRGANPSFSYFYKLSIGVMKRLPSRKSIFNGMSIITLANPLHGWAQEISCVFPFSLDTSALASTTHDGGFALRGKSSLDFSNKLNEYLVSVFEIITSIYHIIFGDSLFHQR